jgi:membrane-associated protease RseP (regulator of RpoE activity)
MRVWKVTGGVMAALGAVALVMAASAPVSGDQQTYTIKRGNGADPRVVVRGQLPWSGGALGGVRVGVTVRDVTADDVTKMKLTGQAGVVIDAVDTDSPAAKGGVLKGDVAVSFDGETVRSMAQFTRLVRETAPGRTVKMDVMRDGKRVALSVAPEAAADRGVRAWIDEPGMRADIERDLDRLRRQPGREFRVVPREGVRRFELGHPGEFRWEGEPGSGMLSFSTGRGRLGVTLQDLTPELAEFFGVKEGALVSSVQKDTPAAKAGIKAGDVVTAVDGKTVTGPGDVVEQLRDKSGEVSVSVVRDKKTLTLKATIEKAETLKPKIVIRGVPS